MINLRKSKVGMKENVEYQLKDAQGNIKPLFQPNRLMIWGMKKGIVSPFSRLPIFGNYADKMVISNLVTEAGVAGIAARINAAGAPAAFTYIAIGEGTTAAADADTELEAECTASGGARASATCTVVTTDTPGDTAQLVNTFNFTTGAAYAVTESGVLNAASDGTLLARQVFSAINVASGDSLQITWKIDVDTA